MDGKIRLSRATFAAGCFWGVEESFANLFGVISTQVGYSGGNVADPTYRDVCRGDTGHAEAVEVMFDPNVVSYEDLLDHLFSIHDPTTPNRQGPDVGHQYRSAIFYHDEAQKQKALKAIDGHCNDFARPIVTEIAPAGPFYRAEEYHQRYLAKNGMAHCRI
ncbi:MAG: peptide-methionine (S)-S-oxide reductase MsrA [Candidatus Thermoplasmatota archaeon]|nr:peptide-methionine (S)-S-oxide reductase MsrA [Candidatus Thermoplasmatota archaeon]